MAGEIKKLHIILVKGTTKDKEGKEVPDYDKALAGFNDKQKSYSDSTEDVLIAQFNPETFSLSLETTKATESENETKPINKESKKNNVSNEKPAVTKANNLSFKLIFDSSFAESPDVKKAVDFLNALFYKKETVVASNVVVKYGSVINFQGAPSKLTLNYLLFDSEGYPVRVAADLEFTGRNITALAGRSPGTLTIEGAPDSSESLSTYAAKKLGDAAAYTAVAKANKLPNLMKLTPGVKLKIPGQK